MLKTGVYGFSYLKWFNLPPQDVQKHIVPLKARAGESLIVHLQNIFRQKITSSQATECTEEMKEIVIYRQRSALCGAGAINGAVFQSAIGH